MKKSLVALAVLAASAAATAAPQANTFYAGAKAGWANFRDGFTQFDAKHVGHQDGYGINKNTVTYGVFGGYQILNQNNFGLAAELGYDYFGRARGNTTFEGENEEKVAAKHTAHGAHLSLKPSYEVIPNLDVYGKVGVALIRNDYFVQTTPVKGNRTKVHTLKPSLTLGAGVEYAILPELAARIEYQYVNKVGNLDKAARKADKQGTNYQFSPDLHSVSAGLSYRFGQGAAPVAAPAEVVTKNFSFSSDVLFAFGKSSLKPAAAQALDAANNEINALGLANPAIQVNGYADRIGKQAANLKLSQRRAETVANYLVSKGQNAANVTAVGYGSANPVTGNTCDAVKGRKALIACLAPDRRVEVQVQGSKEVTM
ncbi:porin OmpA [Actinobacillus minor]|uniref:porin OmpA n=1 Tax=Actinobacillus minor TaxID=51047 RepID=UPI0023F19A99|nr:porin OmpA [Actinobacillus minor]MDD6911139.1 porin OmpA [Actinobacillus minor]MDY4713654.1 porin OmpA [Actinobacillus minor]